jgi:hypothetical protein
MASDNEEIIQLRKDMEEDRARFSLFLQAYIDRQKQQDIAHERNMEAILETNRNVASLATSISGLVEAWTVAIGFNKFLKWLSSFAVLSGLLAWLADIVTFHPKA